MRKGDLSGGDVDGCDIEAVLYESLCAGYTSSAAQFENVSAWGEDGEELIEIVEAGGVVSGGGPSKVSGGNGIVAELDERFGIGRLES